MIYLSLKDRHSHNAGEQVLLNIPKMKTCFMVPNQYRLSQLRTGII